MAKMPIFCSGTKHAARKVQNDGRECRDTFGYFEGGSQMPLVKCERCAYWDAADDAPTAPPKLEDVLAKVGQKAGLTPAELMVFLAARG